ncbi:MAG: hypothetical protein ABFC67_14800 [Mizugakiibacter sp.]|uniref:hypothetical protein n=1 Tax=Mizugakiibacter sp. TaxID=1972610 RepID=UPI00320E015B
MMFLKCGLLFLPTSSRPTVEGDYLLYNQCDGYHIAEARKDDDGEIEFYFFGSGMPVSRESYCAWAMLPDTQDMFPLFARKPGEGAGA